MTATLLASCPTCGGIEITAADVTIAGATYQFECPHCDLHVSKPATPQTIGILTAAGVRHVRPLLPIDAGDLRRALDDTAGVWAELRGVQP